MKKAASSILILVLFLVNTGFVVNMHYCMNRLQTVEIGKTEKESCGKCGMSTEDSDGCCRSESKIVKLQQDLLHAKTVTPVVSEPALTASLFIESLFFASTYIETNFSFSSLPPPPGFTDICISYCVFRI